MSIDKYLGRKYNARSYNCAHLVCDVWQDLKGPELGEYLRAYLCGESDRKVVLTQMRKIKFLDEPESPCVVLFQSPRQIAHVGIWIRGRVLHLLEGQQCVQFQPLKIAGIGFKSIRFFTC